MNPNVSDSTVTSERISVFITETLALAYATTSSNTQANLPNPVAVVNDSVGGDRQIVVLGVGDGTTNLISPALESGGNLATLAGAVSSSKVNVNIASGNITGYALDATLTGGTQQSKITNGTNIADVVAGDSGFNGVAVASGVKTYTFTTSASGAQTILANTPTEGYSYIEVVYTSVGAGLALTGQFSTISGGTYVNTSGFSSSPGSSASSALGAAVNTIYAGSIRGNYFQIAVSALTSGTFTGTVTLRAIPPPLSGVVATSAPSSQTIATGSITTSSTAVTSGSVSSMGGFALVTVHGSYSGVSFGITVSDDGGTTFYPVPVYDTVAQAWLATGATITPGTNATKSYWVPVAPITNEIKVLASAFSSGSASVRIGYSYSTNNPGSTMANIWDSAGNARGANVTAGNALLVDASATTQPVSGTVTANTNLAPTATSLNTYSLHSTSNATTTPTASTAYISVIAISNEVGGTTSTITIQDKQGTPLKLVNGLATTALTTAPTIITFNTPVKMVSGIDIITAGAVAATVDVWLNYFQ